MPGGNDFVARLFGAKGAHFDALERWTGVTSAMPTGMFWVEGDATMPSAGRYLVYCLAASVGVFQIAIDADNGMLRRRVLAPGVDSAWVALSDPERDSLTVVTATAVTLAFPETLLVSTDTGNTFALPDGEYVGQRKLLVAEIDTGGDTILAAASALAKLDTLQDFGQPLKSISAVSFDADGEHLLLEWTGTLWRVVSYSCTITASPRDSLSVETGTAVTLAFPETLLVSTGVGNTFDLPDGAYIGQRKALVASIVGGSDTILASAAALAKLIHLGMSGETPNGVDTLTLDADNELVLMEWTGLGWNVLYASTGVISVS